MSMAEDLVPVFKLCESHAIDVKFVTALGENGLIEIIRDGDALFVHVGKIPRLEKIIRLHFDLHINLEGIEAITHLLERVEMLQRENAELRNRLRLFE